MSRRSCRFCASPLHSVVADLGMSPFANSYVTQEQLGSMEPFYPLCALVCENCFLVQLEEYESPSHIFTDYAYFSSFSSSWLSHCDQYALRMIEERDLDSSSCVVEIASNDGYLLQSFVQRGVPVLGIEPAVNVAQAAQTKGVSTITEFFGEKIASELSDEYRADLLIGNNVLAHVPDLNDFVEGMHRLLKSDGLITMEFPHLLRLLEDRIFDTIYHEHVSYFSFSTARKVFERHGLDIFDVEELPTHGGSLRIHATHSAGSPGLTPRAQRLLRIEVEHGLGNIDRYLSFGNEVKREKRAILRSLISWKEDGLTIAGYGAPAKGNTLLNYCGVGTDVLDFTVDRSPYKQGRYLPGSHIPIRAVESLHEHRPDLVLILPWNLRTELMSELTFVHEWGGRLAARTPELVIIS